MTISIINLIIILSALIMAFLLGALVFRAGTRVSFLKEHGYYPPVANTKAPDKKKETEEKNWDDV